MDEYENIQLT